MSSTFCEQRVKRLRSPSSASLADVPSHGSRGIRSVVSPHRPPSTPNLAVTRPDLTRRSHPTARAPSQAPSPSPVPDIPAHSRYPAHPFSGRRRRTLRVHTLAQASLGLMAGERNMTAWHPQTGAPAARTDRWYHRQMLRNVKPANSTPSASSSATSPWTPSAPSSPAARQAGARRPGSATRTRGFIISARGGMRWSLPDSSSEILPTICTPRTPSCRFKVSAQTCRKHDWDR